MFRATGKIKEGWAYIGNRELRPDDLDVKEGIVYVKQEPSLTLTFEEVARRYFVTGRPDRTRLVPPRQTAATTKVQRLVLLRPTAARPRLLK